MVLVNSLLFWPGRSSFLMESKFMNGSDVDILLYKFLNVGSPGDNDLCQVVTESEIVRLCENAKKIFAQEKTLIDIFPPVRICGDIHGQYCDLLRLLDRGGFPPYSNYLFLGDYVDRGHQSLEVILLFLAFKVKYPNNFFLLRGNHECASINRVYGFYEECIRRYKSSRIWNVFQAVFAQMPLCALVGERILCMHGGISKKIESLSQLRTLERNMLDPNPESLQIDLLWADPDPVVKDFTVNSRGVSVIFGTKNVNAAIKQLKIDLIVRAHQVVQDGYEFFANKRLVTIFSAPHYCGQFDNAAAMMVVDEDMVCSFHIIRPTIRQIKSVPVENTISLG